MRRSITQVIVYKPKSLAGRKSLLYDRAMKFILSLLLLLMMAAPVQAADLFIRKNPPAQEAPVAAPVIPQAQQPITLPIAETVPADAPKTMGEFAKQYYKGCIEKNDAVVNGANLQTQCNCTAQKILQEFTLEDINAVPSQTANGAFQRSRILLEAYAPCMEHPARGILLEKCVKDPAMQKLPNYEQSCNCMANRMAQYVTANGSSIIAKSLRNPTPSPNPLSDLMREPDFQAQAQRELAECVKNPAAPPHTDETMPYAPSLEPVPPVLNRGIEIPER